MNTQPLEQLAGKRILIWGFGREGRSTLRFLRTRFPELRPAVADAKRPDDWIEGELDFIEAAGWSDAFTGYDLIFKSPGIPTLDPRVDRTKITSQTDLFLRCLGEQVIGITGTKGKSTTVSLLYHVLRESGIDARLVGNIGFPCLDFFDEITPKTVVVFEMSCHQLEYLSASPHVGVLLNLFEDHLDHYGTFEYYAASKMNICRYQKPDDVAILNIDQPLDFPQNFISASMQGHANICVQGRKIQVCGLTAEIAPQDTTLVGAHNLYDIAIVYYIARKLCGVSEPDFRAALRTFHGLPHRMQFIGERGGVLYYDDSISTIVQTTIHAIESLEAVDTVLIGGMDRGIAYAALVDYLLRCRVRNIILMPDSGGRIYDMLAVRDLAFCAERVQVVSGLEEAVVRARQLTAPGKICLLSPAAASYGFFENFEARGDRFRELVFAD